MTEKIESQAIVNDNSIDIRNAAWNGELLGRYHKLLVGGSLIDAAKAEFIYQKPSESVSSSMAQAAMPNSGSPESNSSAITTQYQPSSFQARTSNYEYRVKKTSYKPMISSLFGYLTSRVFPENPTIKGNKRYQDMILDCDGDGKTLLTVARDALINALTYSHQGSPCGSYLFVQEMGEGTADLRITTEDARSVIDWNEDDHGDLQNVRTRYIANAREDKFGPQTKKRWTWSVYGPDGCRTWTGEKPIRANGRPGKATGPAFDAYDYGGSLPFVRVKMSEHQYLMDQLAATIVEVFNLDSDIASLCGKISNAQLVLNTDDKNLGQIVLPSLGLVCMDRGTDAKFISPDPACADPLFRYKQDLRDSLYNAINASAMRASADLVQNPRQAATAKAMDLEPWRAWSITFTAPVIAAFNKAFAIIAAYYKESPPEITWPEPLDISKGGIDSALMGGKKDGTEIERAEGDGSGSKSGS